MNKILVTGGAGYIGSILVEELLKNIFQVTVIDNFLYSQNSLAHLLHYNNLEVYNGDCRDKDLIKNLIKKNDIDAIYIASLNNTHTELIKQISKEQDRYFDSDFYFDPTGNKALEEDYAAQKEDVAAAWAAAKKNPNALINDSLGTWAQQAYRFGSDLTNKDDFARLHFQIIGQGKGYDAAKDILTAANVKDYIYSEILPALEDEALENETIFGKFIKPKDLDQKSVVK